ncbi:hypothetical protein [Chitiniphilus shinanonensis]|uniref:hypothetical protein n=1 Tax=Chitiniphilus shinanonensis TaxID=553088 RepID=UPI00306D35B2
MTWLLEFLQRWRGHFTVGAAMLVIGVAAGALVGWHFGGQAGDLRAERAERRQADAAVATLTQTIQTTRQLIDDANQASTALREAAAARARVDDQTTQELRRALAKTAATRLGCRFDDDVMRQLEAARDRAAAAAAHGVRGSVPGAGEPDRQQP